MDSRRVAVHVAVVAGSAALIAVAISVPSKRRAPTVEGVRATVAAKNPDDPGPACADVGDIRACWSADGTPADAHVVPRSLPEGAPPVSGWRCSGTRNQRACEDRARNAGPWRCSGARCVQHEPRMPDDGEWECVEMDGVAFCRGGSSSGAAGVVQSSPDRGWTCGARRGVGGPERICVDLSPDRPDVEGTWACRFTYSGDDSGRVCLRSDATVVGGACLVGGTCPEFAACIGGRCLPPPPTPGCWLDRDCGPDVRCRWGSCVERGS